MENPGGQKRKFFPSPTGGNVLLSVLIFFFSVLWSEVNSL